MNEAAATFDVNCKVIENNETEMRMMMAYKYINLRGFSTDRRKKYHEETNYS